jgi:hypothetical protein
MLSIQLKIFGPGLRLIDVIKDLQAHIDQRRLRFGGRPNGGPHMLPHNSATDAADARTATRTVFFRNSFTLTALETRQPAGDYLIEIDEERLAAVSFPAYRRVATWLRIPAVSGTGASDRLVNVDPAELEPLLLPMGLL